MENALYLILILSLFLSITVGQLPRDSYFIAITINQLSCCDRVFKSQRKNHDIVIYEQANILQSHPTIGLEDILPWAG